MLLFTKIIICSLAVWK